MILRALLALLVLATPAFGQVGQVAGWPSTFYYSGGGGGGNITVANHNWCGAYAGTSQVTSGTCTVTVSAIGDTVAFAPAGCNGPSCGTGSMPQITSLTYSGGSCSDISNTYVTTGTAGTDIWQCANMAASGSVTLSFTASGGGGTGGLEYAGLFWADLSNAATSSPAELGNNATGATINASPFTLGLGSGGNSPTTVNNELVFAVCSMYGAAGLALTAQQTQLDNHVSGAQTITYLDEYTTVATPATSPMGCTPNQGSQNYAISVAAFKPGNGGSIVAYIPPIPVTGW